MTTEIIKLLGDIQNWMLDNDYDCGEQGAKIYARISAMLGEPDEE